jgi:hypothetical protein
MERIRATIELFEFTFYAIRVYSKESLWACLYIPVSVLGNNSVKTFRSREELLEASSSVRSVSCQRKVGDYFFPFSLVTLLRGWCYGNLRYSLAARPLIST